MEEVIDALSEFLCYLLRVALMGLVFWIVTYLPDQQWIRTLPRIVGKLDEFCKQMGENQKILSFLQPVDQLVG